MHARKAVHEAAELLKEKTCQTKFRSYLNGFTPFEKNYWDWMSRQANFLTTLAHDEPIEAQTVEDIINEYNTGTWLREYYTFT